MKKTIYTLALGALLLTGCSQEETPACQGEEVKVTFTANVPEGVQSRAEVESPLVNTLVCGIYDENGVKVKDKYDEVGINDDKTTFTYTPTLIKGKTYQIVFWAYNKQDGKTPYNIDDLTKVSINDTSADMEAFTNATSISVPVVLTAENQGNLSVSLKRPYAKVNLGITKTDWENASVLCTLNKATLSLTGCPVSYNALTGLASEEILSEALIYTNSSLSDDESLVVNENNYIPLVTGYTFAVAEQKIACELSLYKEGSDEVFVAYNYQDIDAQENYRSNIVGQLLTGNVTYTVTLDTEEDKKENEE